MIPTSLRQRLPGIAFVLAIAAVFLMLKARNSGLYPMVFADEWLYSQASRLQPLGESILPSYLYLALYRLTSACGSGFLDCARMLNTLMFVASAPFIYLVARPVTGRVAAAVVAIASLLAPVNSVTVYFMPEAMYFFGFWFMSWVLLRENAKLDWKLGLLTGAVLGLLALVKVHALFLLPAAGAWLLWRGWREGAWQQGLLVAVLLGVSALLVKTAVAYALAGPAGLDLLGSFYGKHAHNTGGGLAQRLGALVRSLYGHLMALGLLFGVPMLAVVAAAVSGKARHALQAPGRSLFVYLALALGATLAMTAAYTSSIADAGPQEGLRLHMRYYDFVFPLLLIAAASQGQAAPEGWLRRLAIALPAGLLMQWAAVKLPFYASGFVDSPELVALANKPEDVQWLLYAQWAAMALWVLQAQIGRWVFVLLVLPFMAWNGSMAVHDILLRAASAPNAYDKAGLYVRQALGPRERAALAIAGDDQAGLNRAQFHADSGSATAIVLQPGDPLDAKLVPAQRQWLLVVGQHALPQQLRADVSNPDFALVRLPPPPRPLYSVSFNKPLEGGPVTDIAGLAGIEYWGRWSDGNRVSLHFAKPLPRRLVVTLKARAYGPNAGKDFRIGAGDASDTFRLTSAEQEVVLRLATDGAQKTLTIDVPAATVPPDAGGRDPRALGIGMLTMEIAEQQ